MPTIYMVPNDDYDLKKFTCASSRIAPNLLQRSNNNITVFWFGNREALKEILYADELADACLFWWNHITILD
jgi:hypothetical protein